MRKALLVVVSFVAFVAFGCGPRQPPEPRVWNVSARAVWDSYRDGGSHWTGQRIRVSFAAGEYEVSPNGVRWHAERISEPAAMIFFAAGSPKDNLRAITVTGTVRGPQVDNVGGGFKVSWYILVTDCSITPP